MNAVSKFIVLIERKRLGRRLTAALTALSMLATGFVPASVHAAPKGHDKATKLARDLDEESANVGAPKAKWARDVNGVRHVQAIVVSNSADPALTDLRAWVLGTGGSVHAALPGISALTVQLPANRVRQLGQRSDVVSVSPNRVTQRTASTLESITGALANNVRSSSTKTSYSGFDGAGVGIAILDSGVMKTHEGLQTSGAAYRVKKNVSMLGTTQANWTTGVNGSTTSLQPGSTALAELRVVDQQRQRHARKTPTATARTWRRWPPGARRFTPPARPTRPASPPARTSTTSRCSTARASARSATPSKASSG